MTVAWTLTPLRYLVDRIESGTSVNAADVPAAAHELGVLKTSCVSLGRFVPSENKQVNDDERDRVTCPVLPGRLIVSRMNTPSLVGAAGFTDTAPANLFLPDRLWQVSTKSSDAKFLYWWMQSQEFRDQVKLICVGTSSSMQNLSQGDFLSFTLRIPSVSHQRTVAHFLNRETAQIDDLIGKQERLIELLAEKRQAVITKAVTKGLDANAPTKPSGIPWLGSIPAHWKASRLKFSLKRIEQGVSPQADAIPASSDSWGVLKSGCVNGGIFKEHENKQLPIDFAIDPCIVVAVGDLLVSRASGSPKLVGSAARVRSLESKLILSDKTFRFVPGQDIDADFLECVLNSQPYRKQVEGSISGAEGLANNISTTALKNIAFALPPRSEQLTISEELRHRVDALLSLESKSTRAVQLLRERRSALISAAVTGRLDYDLD